MLGANFQCISERLTSRRRLKKAIRLDVVGTVVEALTPPLQDTEERMVVGVVAQNPFFRKMTWPRELADLGGGVQVELSETELLLCSLRDNHDESSAVDYYELQGFEVTEAGRGPIIRPFGTWNELAMVSTARRKRAAG